MNAESSLIWVKVLGLVAAGVAFVWWQFRDLAREKKRTTLRQSRTPADKR